MSLSLTLGDNLCAVIRSVLFEARELAREQAEKLDLSPILIIVPDRLSLRAEQILLEDGGSFLNLNILTFSRLYNLIADELVGDEKKRNAVDKTSGVLFMWRAIKSVSAELNFYRKAAGKIGFAEQMFNTINQLSASNFYFSFDENLIENSHLKDKIRDIKKIYASYNAQISPVCDEGGQLGFLRRNINASELIRRANVFVVGFDYLPPARFSVLEEIFKSAKGVFVGAKIGSEFENAVKDATKNSAKTREEKILPQTKYEMKIATIRCGSEREEAERIADEIVGLIKNGVRFGDIKVILGNFEKFGAVYAEVFKSAGIEFNIDLSQKLSETAKARFIKSLFELAAEDNAEALIKTLSFGEFDLGEDYFEVENAIIKNNLRLSSFKADARFNELSASINKLKKLKTAREFCEFLDGFAQGEDDVLKKMQGLFETISDIFGDEEISADDFYEMISSVFDATKISGIPQFADRVLIASVADFEPTEVPHLFVGGAISGAMPIEKRDNDLLIEQDIALLKKIKITIDPSVSLQNYRAARHLDNIVFGAKKSLTVSCAPNRAEGERPSSLFLRLERAGAEQLDKVFAEPRTKGRALDMLLSAMANGTTYRNEELYSKIINTLGANEFIVDGTKKYENLSRGAELFRPKKVVSTTQIEKFYKCPYQAFLGSGLGIRKRKIYGMASDVIGTIIHAVLEKVFGAFIGKNVDDFDIRALSEAAFNETIKDDEIKVFAEDKNNKPIILNLKKQIFGIVDALVSNMKEGFYRPKYLEKDFSDGVIKGRADRVDAYKASGKEFAVVYDYKTGAESGFSFKELYFGEKLQLPIYSGLLAKDHTMGGAMYVGLPAGYGDKPKTAKLAGLVLDDNDNRRALGYSGINESANDFLPKRFVSREDFDAVIEYAKTMVNIAIDAFDKGVVAPSPINDKSCRNCPALAVCEKRGTNRADGFPQTMNIKHITSALTGGQA
ncbi:MAG: PD-(D/E)XK nuclease family protein [Christensenellaceae bacterium]|nr:PD-(D/E)XK nuclease family protein [Christensenellaceae bacterium]